MRMLLLIGSAMFLASSAALGQVNSAELKWGPPPPGLPPGAEAAVLSGDPEKAGLFTVRLKFPANYTVQPHHHPSDELVTVIEGQVALGMGDTYDVAKMKALTQGGYAVAKAQMNHFVTSSTGGIVQISAQGPFKITYVNPKDDPRNTKPAERGE